MYIFKSNLSITKQNGMDYSGRPTKRQRIPDPLEVDQVEAKTVTAENICIKDEYCIPTTAGTVGQVITVVDPQGTVGWGDVAASESKGDLVMRSTVFHNTSAQNVGEDPGILLALNAIGSSVIDANNLNIGDTFTVVSEGYFAQPVVGENAARLRIRLKLNNDTIGDTESRLSIPYTGPIIQTDFGYVRIDATIAVRFNSNISHNILVTGSVTLSSPLDTTTVQQAYFQGFTSTIAVDFGVPNTISLTSEYENATVTSASYRAATITKQFVGFETTQFTDQALNTYNDVTFNQVNTTKIGESLTVSNTPESKDAIGGPFNARWRYVNDNRGVGAVHYRSRGTQAIPTALLANDVIATYVYAGHDGTTFNQTATTTSYATEDITPVARGGSLVFNTVDNGTTAPTNKLTLDTAGVRLNDAYQMPIDAGLAGDVITSDGLGDSTWLTPFSADQTLNTTDNVQFNNIEATGTIIAKGPLTLGTAPDTYYFRDTTFGAPDGSALYYNQASKSIVFIAPSFAHSYMTNNATPTVITNNVYTFILGNRILGLANDWIFSGPSSILQYLGDGFSERFHQVTASVTWEDAGDPGSELFSIAIFKDGILVPGSEIYSQLDGTNVYPRSATTSAIVGLTEFSEIDLRVRNAVGLNDVLIRDMTITVHSI